MKLSEIFESAIDYVDVEEYCCHAITSGVTEKSYSFSGKRTNEEIEAVKFFTQHFMPKDKSQIGEDGSWFGLPTNPDNQKIRKAKLREAADLARSMGL